MEYDIEKAGLSFLRDLKFADSFEEFHTPDWDCYTLTEFRFLMDPFGNVWAEEDDTLGTFVDRIYNSGYSGRRVNYLEMVLMLMTTPCFSTSHFLETVTHKANGREAKILRWLARKIDIPKFGARALGKAACLNNFEAVDTLLGENVDVNSLVDCPHFVPDCCCEIRVIEYAQLQRFDREEPGPSDDMIAHLLARGAANPKGANMCLMDHLRCLLCQQNGEEGILLPKVQAIVEQIHGFADVVCGTESVLETCIFWWEQDDKVSEGRRQVLDYLLEQGAKTFPGSPLAVSIYMACPGELHWNLLDKTANINAYCSSAHRSIHWYTLARKSDQYSTVWTVTPLQAAALRGDETIIHILLQKGADVNCPARDTGGVTALQAICFLKQKRTRDRAKKMRLVKLLLDHGPNVNAGPALDFGLTALQAAAFVGDVQVADLLVSRGADVNAPACKYNGGTAVALAARRGHVDMVRSLLPA